MGVILKKQSLRKNQRRLGSGADPWLWTKLILQHRNVSLGAQTKMCWGVEFRNFSTNFFIPEYKKIYFFKIIFSKLSGQKSALKK